MSGSSPGLPGRVAVWCGVLLSLACTVWAANTPDDVPQTPTPPISLAHESKPGPTRHWAFQPITPLPLPAVSSSARNEVDRFIFAELARKDLSPTQNSSSHRKTRSGNSVRPT